MFRIDPEPKFWTTVKVSLPGEPAQTFRARFIARGGADWQDMAVADLLDEVWIDWDEIVGEDGKPAAFSNELRKRLLDTPHVRVAVARAYFAGLSGAAEGN